MSHSGKVVTWLERSGYGFVQCQDYDTDLFIHHSAFGGGNLIEGKTITFDVDDDPRGGKKRCINVRGPALDDAPPRRRDSRDRDRDRDRRRSEDRYDRRGGGRRNDSRDRRGRDRRDDSEDRDRRRSRRESGDRRRRSYER
ncbi:hypothetical protein DIPPA_30398 [Diplonema papillatum]|nr:hypothetical protein DIPPA_30398 [Diplonema papillatum]